MVPNVCPPAAKTWACGVGCDAAAFGEAQSPSSSNCVNSSFWARKQNNHNSNSKNTSECAGKRNAPVGKGYGIGSAYCSRARLCY